MSATVKHPGPAEPDTTTTKRAQEPHRWGKRSRVPRSWMGNARVAVLTAAVVLLLLLIFILQNSQRADVSFLGMHGHLPVGVALLLAAVFGVLLVALPGTVRIIQLRRLGRRHGRDLEHHSSSAPAPVPSSAPDDSVAR
jgi:lipopolysaccharide assembly protein A